MSGGPRRDGAGSCVQRQDGGRSKSSERKMTTEVWWRRKKTEWERELKKVR